MTSNAVFQKERTLLLAIVEGIIRGTIKSHEDLSEVWPPLPFATSELNAIWDDVEDAFEHTPRVRPGDIRSSAYLHALRFDTMLLVAREVLKFDVAPNIMFAAYKETLKIPGLSKEDVPERVKGMIERPSGASGSGG